VNRIQISAESLIAALIRLSATESVCILDSCGVGHLGSHLMVSGIEPLEMVEIASADPRETLALLDEKLSGNLASIFTISYDFGLKLLGIEPRKKPFECSSEPDVFVACFDTLLVYDYDTETTDIVGNPKNFESIKEKLFVNRERSPANLPTGSSRVTSNFTKAEYLAAINEIKERIRDGDTYQTNLTQQLTAKLPLDLTPEIIFERLRRDHAAPFAAFIKRSDSTVVSASPERFFCVRTPHGGKSSDNMIQTSPIKGTSRRGSTVEEDDRLRSELLSSSKDRAENTMIVDLLRNDLGRVCEFGSVSVDKLCDLEEHPTLFHLVSTISGQLRDELKFSDILKAVFPCGSITGAPKISTMKIIDEIETADRGLSMGAMGYYIPASWGAGIATYDLSVAIRTMVIRDNVASFNVGGGITIDSDPAKEYDETMLKAKALLNALGTRP